MLKPPAWAQDAKPINRGWIHHLTGELLVSRKHSDREIEEYYIAKADAAPASEPTPEPIIEADPEPGIVTGKPKVHQLNDESNLC